jgi:hypothetical protein
MELLASLTMPSSWTRDESTADVSVAVDPTSPPRESCSHMTKQATISENVGRLEARVSVFNDHLKASAKETSEQLHAHADKLRATIKTGKDELSADMKETSTWIAKRATGLRTAVTADIDAARTKHDATKHSDKVTLDAEVAEAYAAATHSDAVAAIAESEQAAIEALAARAAVTDLAAAAKH